MVQGDREEGKEVARQLPAGAVNKGSTQAYGQLGGELDSRHDSSCTCSPFDAISVHS